MAKTRLFSDVEFEFIKLAYPTVTNKELSEYLNCKKSRLDAMGSRNGWKKLFTTNDLKDDLQDKTIGKLTVIRNTGKKSKNNYVWECRCECNKIINFRASLLRNKKVKDCGCGSPPRIGRNHHNRTGYGNLSGTSWSKIKSHAKERGILFDICPEFAWNLYEKQDRKCAISNLDISFSNIYTKVGDNTASLDRIDCSKPYTEDNVQWIHKKINFMKHIMTNEELIQICHTISDYNRKKNQE